MPAVYFHPVTAVRIDQIKQHLPQSLLISGPDGSGLRAVADVIADGSHATVISVEPRKEDTIDYEKGVISVEAIRKLYETTKTIERHRRFIIINDAEKMGQQAQNAFLKLLEEPTQNTYFILLSHIPSKLLPTIISRVQTVVVRKITAEQTTALLHNLKVTDEQRKSQLQFIASGLPARLTRLASDETAFQRQVRIIQDARLSLQGSPYEKMRVIQKYKDNRYDALQLVTFSLKLLEGSVKNTRPQETIALMQRLLNCYEAIEANGNLRLQLAAGML